MPKHRVVTIVALVTSSLGLSASAYAAGAGNESVITDPTGDVRVHDPDSKDLKKAVALAEATRYSVSNAAGEGATLRTTIRLSKLAGPKTVLRQFVIIKFTDESTKKGAGSILIDVNSKMVTIQPTAEGAASCELDATKSVKKGRVAFTADPRCLGVDSTRFQVWSLVEKGGESRSSGADITSDAMDVSAAIDLTN